MEGLHVRAARARHDDEVVADVEVLADLVDPDIKTLLLLCEVRASGS